MKAAVSLLRNRLGFARLHAKASSLERYGWDHLKCNALEPIMSSCNSDYYLPKCRFMQYLHPGDTEKRLGMVSENGTKMIELSARTCAAPDMMGFIHQRYCMRSLLDSTKYMDVDDVKPDLRLLPPLDSPGKIIGVGCNYYDSCNERNMKVPATPEFFVKFGTSITGALDNIRAHQIAKVS